MVEDMSMTDLLIVAGCSFSYSNLEVYKQHGIFAWPKLVAEHLNMELIEISRAGASNSYIENAVTDSILKYKHRDPIVMVLWSQPSRVNGNDCYTYFLEPETAVNEWWCSHWNITHEDIPYLHVINSLRSIWRTKAFAEQHDIEYHHDLSGCWYIPFTKALKVDWKETKDKIRKNWYFQNLEFSIKKLDGSADYSKIPDDGHPDQESHEKIANGFIDKYNRKFKNKEFIYD